MGSEPDPEPSSTPKLSLFSFPSELPDPPGMLTPPLRPPASVPFRWEEAPGKPRAYTTTTLSKPSSGKCLELPPRLLTEIKITNMPSPTTVLDGPFVGRPRAYSASFRREHQRSLSSLEGGEHVGAMVHSKRENKERGYFDGSWRWKSLRENRQSGEDSFVISSASSRVGSSSSSSEGEEGGGVSNTKVKIARFKSENFLSLSNTRSHFWASICGTIKQVVPWRSRKTSKRSGPAT